MQKNYFNHNNCVVLVQSKRSRSRRYKKQFGLALYRFKSDSYEMDQMQALKKQTKTVYKIKSIQSKIKWLWNYNENNTTDAF
jgi:hypothetical protein